MDVTQPLAGVLAGHARPADPRAVAELLRQAGADKAVAYQLVRGDELPRPAPESRRPGRPDR